MSDPRETRAFIAQHYEQAQDLAERHGIGFERAMVALQRAHQRRVREIHSHWQTDRILRRRMIREQRRQPHA